MKHESITPLLPLDYELLSDSPLQRFRRSWDARRCGMPLPTPVNLIAAVRDRKENSADGV